MNILFVCIGSTCRSPAAAALAADLRPDWSTDCRGTAVRRAGAPVDPRMVPLLAGRGIDVSHVRSRQMAPEDLSGPDMIPDLILGLEQRVVTCIDGVLPGAARLLNDAAGLGPTDIPDPFETEDYPTAFAAIERAVHALSERHPPV